MRMKSSTPTLTTEAIASTGPLIDAIEDLKDGLVD
jgi:hypothetical protein